MDSVKDSPSVYRHDCEFCEMTLEAGTLDELQEQGRTHLADQHYEDFQFLFQAKMEGRECLNECGYTYPTDPESDAGFECPECRYDNFPEFANRHIWWQAELE